MTNWNINHYFPEFAKLDRYMIGHDKMAAQISKAFELSDDLDVLRIIFGKTYTRI